MKNRVINIGLLFFSIIISLILCEGILRIITGDEYSIWLPNLKYISYPDPKIFPGIQDTSYLEINSMGLRANTDEVENAVNILVLGGSATECMYLDQNETWPALIEKYLNEKSTKKINVFNGGRSGITSQHHLAQVKMLIEEYPWIDIIIVMQGLNDLQYALSFESDFKPKDIQTVYEEAFWLSPFKVIDPFYRNTYLFKYLSKLKKSLFAHKLSQDPYGNTLSVWRDKRLNAKEIVSSVPKLDSSLNLYRDNTLAMINTAKNKKKEIIFIIQPVAWDSVMNYDIIKYCWYGWIGKSQLENTGKYYSFTALNTMIKMYDKELENVCIQNNIDYIIPSDRLKKDTTTFYDDCHFNESGARNLAGVITDYLLSNSKYKKLSE